MSHALDTGAQTHEVHRSGVFEMRNVREAPAGTVAGGRLYGATGTDGVSRNSACGAHQGKRRAGSADLVLTDPERGHPIRVTLAASNVCGSAARASGATSATSREA